MRWKTLIAAAVALTALTRIPVAPNRLSVEGVNLAFAIEQFDPIHEQPHAPGFPFFILVYRILAFFVPGAHWAFLIGSLLATAACLVVAYRLATDMYSSTEAQAASLLLLVNPIFWFATLQSPLWPYLCLFTLLAAWFSWRAWSGDERSVLYGAAVLGVAFGFLPETVVYMAPLWLVSAWTGTHSRRAITRGIGVIVLGILLSLDMLWVAAGGFEQLSNILAEYPFGSDVPALTLAFNQPRFWVRSLGRFVLWNALTLCVWFWVVFWRRDAAVLPEAKYGRFFLLWILPAAVIHLWGGLPGPGRMVAYAPALCLIGGRVIEGLARPSQLRSPVDPKRMSLWASVMISVLLFGEFVTLPETRTAQTPGVARRLMNVVTYGVWETSVGSLRWFNELADTTLWEVGGLTRIDRPILIVVMNEAGADAPGLGWRIASYYEPHRDFWVLSGAQPLHEARKIRARNLLEIRKGSPVIIPVPRGARIIWLMDSNSPFMAEAGTKVPVNRARKYVTYTDIPDGSAGFQVGSFIFAPS